MTLYPPTFRDLTFSEFSWFAKTKQITGSTHQRVSSHPSKAESPAVSLQRFQMGPETSLSTLSSWSAALQPLASAGTAAKGHGGWAEGVWEGASGAEAEAPLPHRLSHARLREPFGPGQGAAVLDPHVLTSSLEPGAGRGPQTI